MAQFDVYTNPAPETQATVPFLLDIQANLLDDLATRVVIPLVHSSVMEKAMKHLNPSFEIKGTRVVMSTAEMAGVSLKVLGEKVGSLADRRAEILGAIDFLFTGF